MKRSRLIELCCRALVALATLLVSACASERAPINRVQPNALQKSFFVGPDLSDPSDNPEFYYRPTIVSVDYGAAQPGLFTASYAQTLARVGFEITENLLVARLTYERVADTSGMGSPTDNAGQIVAAFAIESHFDIKNAYNPQTGEQLNIVEENTTDRPWYAREYMRVDWSQNLITSAYQLDTLAALKAYSDQAIQYEPAAYSVQDPTNPDAPVFEADPGYFDVTNKVFAKPEVVTTPYGTFPACFFSSDFFNGSGPIGDCNPVELKVRLSFRRVVDRDYEPVDWDGQRMAMFGAFTTGQISPDRLGYDRNYGVVDSKWYRYASRHNIWMQTHVRDATGALTQCADDTSCDTMSGSHCDLYRGACTLPYRQRTTRPVDFYYGPGSDPTLFDSVQKAANDWDSALRHSVQTARYAECVHEGGGPSALTSVRACKTQFPTALPDALGAVPTILSLCHNPVVDSDPESCGARGLAVRVGDLRYNIANVIQSPQVPSPWGIEADADDPLTGEVVGASVNIWNAVTDLATQRAIDLMRWYLGELSTSDVSLANYVKDSNPVASPSALTAYRGPTQLSSAEVNSRISAMDRTLTSPQVVAPLVAPANSQAIIDWAEANTRATYGDAVLGVGNSLIQSRFDTLKGSPVETTLLTEPYLELVGLNSSTPIDANTLEVASPLRGAFWQNRSALERERQLLLAETGSCVLDAAEPSGTIELAQKLLRKFPMPGTGTPPALSAADLTTRTTKWANYLRKRLTRGVIAHEMGHSMGLRHVFTSSFDALNYRPQYWQLRTRDKQETTYCSGPTNDGTSCIGPRWNDPVTPAEREGMLTSWQQTSVMDYPGELTQDMLDIGAYDRAALRMLYANVADMWDESSVRCNPTTLACTSNGLILASQLDSFGGIAGPWYGSVLDPSMNTAFHYSQLDQKLNVIRSCKPADTSPPADWDQDENGIYDPVLDGQIVNGTTCSGIPTDYVRYDDLTAVPTASGAVHMFDDSGRVRRPYMFASDEYADIGNISVYRHDNGADAYEVTSFFINDYEDLHPFDDQRRGRTTFTLTGALMRAFTRYHEKLKEQGKAYALLSEIFSGATALGLTDISNGPAADGLSKPHALATSLTFDHFARMMTRPASGDHFISPTPDPFGNDVLVSTDQAIIVNGPRTDVNQPAPTAPLSIPEGTQNPGVTPSIGGRPLHNALDASKGYYVTQYNEWVGSYYEKTLSMDLMADAIDRFISQSRDDFSDGRYRNVSFATLYPDGVRRLVATALTQDSAMLGWRIPASGTTPLVDATTRQPSQQLGFRVWWPTEGPTMCWPSPGQLGCGDVMSGAAANLAPKSSLPIDPEVGFEVQKFISMFALVYLPDSWKRDWVDLMRIFQVGTDPSPSFTGPMVSFSDPVSGVSYVAHSYGKENIDGRDVERGVGGRVLEWANTLAASAYQVASTDPDTGLLTYATYADDSNCPPGISRCTGQAIQLDPAAATRLTNYKTVLDFVRTLTAELGFYGPAWRGVN